MKLIKTIASARRNGPQQKECSHNLWVIQEITSVCCTLYICNKISIRKPLVYISHIQLFWFPFNLFSKLNINLTEVFHIKSPRPAFSFLPPVSFQIFTAGFSSRIFIFPLVHWPKKSDYSGSDISLFQDHVLPHRQLK